LPRWRGAILSFGGPVILVLVVVVWIQLLNIGTALIVYPNLGDGIQNTSGPTSKSFLTALYVGGVNLAVVGSSNYAFDEPTIDPAAADPERARQHQPFDLRIKAAS
jgi:hypothetical protein